MNSAASFSVFVLITFAFSVAVAAVDVNNQAKPNEESRLTHSSVTIPQLHNTVRTWQETALQRARQKLLEMEEELEESKNSRFCEKKKKNMLRRLYWKKRTIRCPRNGHKNANAECKKKDSLKTSISKGRKKCSRDKNCLATHVWPLQWKLRMVNKACECTRLWHMMRKIWRVKAIKCPRTRNVWEIKHDIHDLEQKIEYLERFVHAKPSVAPRASRED